MPKINGAMEWDDSSLRPGFKREGGLHSTLFDADGNLQGSARFIPDEEGSSESADATEDQYISTEDRRTSPMDQVLVAAISAMVAGAVVGLAFPRIKEWWGDKGKPFVSAKWAQLRTHVKQGNHQSLSSEHEETDGGQGLGTGTALSIKRQKMSSEEAQARYLAILAAEVYRDEQIRLINNADIVDVGELDEIPALLSRYPTNELEQLLKKMVQDPSLLSDNYLAQLTSAIEESTRNQVGGIEDTRVVEEQ